MCNAKKSIIKLVVDADQGVAEAGVFVQAVGKNLLKVMRKPSPPGEILQAGLGLLAEKTLQWQFPENGKTELNGRTEQY
jgi:hypothetical protein